MLPLLPDLMAGSRFYIERGRAMRVLVILLCLIAGSAFAAPDKKLTSRMQRNTERDTEAKALTTLIQENLPSGWTTTYHHGYTAQSEWAYIEIKRLKPTAMYSRPVFSVSVPNPNEKLDKPASLPNYAFVLRIDNFLSVPAYRKIKSVNTNKEKEMTKLVVGLIWGKGYYIARTVEEKQRVQRYEELEKSLYSFPDYYWRHLSLTNLNDDLEGKPDYELVVDAKVRAECKRVTLKVLGLLTPYEKAILSSAKAKN
jgi:hypothetical protein